MKTLKNLVCLSHRVSIYVPSTVNVDKQIDNTVHVNKTATMLSELFGGATSSDAIGFWNSSEKGLVRENTTIVFAFAESLSNEAIDKLIDHCEEMKVAMVQEAIALEIDGRMYFV